MSINQLFQRMDTIAMFQARQFFKEDYPIETPQSVLNTLKSNSEQYLQGRGITLDHKKD